MRRYEQDTEEFDQQTAVMDALPHAIHPMHGDWRTKADELIDGLRARGWDVVRLTPDASEPHPGYCFPSLHETCGSCHRCTPTDDTWPEADALAASQQGHADYCCRQGHGPRLPLLTCCTCGAS